MTNKPHNPEPDFPKEALSSISSVFNPEDAATITTSLGDLMLRACEIVAHVHGIVIENVPALLLAAEDAPTILAGIARHAQFRTRQVILEKDWWKFDNGPLLAFDKTTHTPYALLPSRSGGYSLQDPVTGIVKIMTPALAATLSEQAYFFYKTLPAKVLNWKDLLFFNLKNQQADLTRSILLQLAITLLGLLIPIITGTLFDTVIPNADIPSLAQFIIGLGVITLSTSLFFTGQLFCVTRIKFKFDVALQSAIWDRLLSLPVSFFRKYSAGDLTNRASAIDSIAENLTTTAMQSIVNGLLSVLTLGLMFYYDYVLAIGAIILTLIAILITLITSLLELRYQRLLQHIQGYLTGFLLQVLTSIAKLRVARAEGRAFALWAKKYATRNKLFLKAGKIMVWSTTIFSFYNVLITIALFTLVILRGKNLSFGNFIIFNSAFGQFFAATLGLFSTIIGLLRIVPLYERAKPILEALPENYVAGIYVNKLVGHVQLREINFRYFPEYPLVLKNISIDVPAGAFIAIVGPSGAGKSSLFRLLLGFEQPEHGSIIYDDRNVKTLNLGGLRQQLGTVMQNSMVMSGTIYENIAGNYTISSEEAWHYAELTSLADTIKAMPMGMHTFVSENGGTLSVGQRQRLLLARALAGKPKVLLLDEATSALDNVTQSIVQKNLENIHVTRIVAAHRLSTVIHADHIYVLDKGEIVEQGSYEQLMAKPGLFTELAKQQIL